MSPIFELLATRWPEISVALWQHIYLSMGSVAFGILISVPLGIWLSSRDKTARMVLGVFGAVQTIPSLAFLGFVLPVLGIGTLPAMTVLFIYSVLPILRNTYTAIKEVNPALLEAGTGMGMTARELLFMVKLPMALPVIMSGIKISTVYIISWTTFSALIGAGGLGDLIYGGMNVYDLGLIVAGTIPAALLAILAGSILGRLERAVKPRGLR
ncbi:osmotically activated L-carnitine/choline ABC transporter [Desulfocucumis palustris]|uniref:Osmotically activated L-carnitine/choline ABC transporter n=1 Tax=Desulfocucumis palustris TaxID=1898651 RepID=A0A2L2X952_9FIRM|nr:ABC transporter permease [Desulfocucumis palustris]GBF32552.1 osmotically activated L-carnitine/choline ABC transporter [Desulfocucumis palustris]